MKLNYNQFKFVVKNQRLTKKIWEKYVSLIKNQKTTKLSDDDKYFLHQVRKSSKEWSREVTAIHLPTAVSVTSIMKDQKINRKEMVTKLLNKVKETRKDLKKSKDLVKQFDGASYKTVGGVFHKPNQINIIAQHTTTSDPYAAKVPRLAHKNYIGIEIEFNEKAGVSRDTIADTLKDAGLARYVSVASDGSCGWEVRVLVPEDDYADPLIKILKIIRDLGHTADLRCGTHVHFDMRNRDVKMVYANLFKTQKFLRKFLTRPRKHNRFCMVNKAETFDKQLSIGDRYYSLNVQSYSRHNTLEVRMHQGTLDENEIIPWIKLLLKIVNYKTALETKVNTLRQAKKQFEIDETLEKTLEGRIIDLFRSNKPQQVAPMSAHISHMSHAIEQIIRF